MNIAQYFKDTMTELKHVSWPTKKQTVIYTSLVVAISFFVAAYLGVFDYVFSNILQKIIG